MSFNPKINNNIDQKLQRQKARPPFQRAVVVEVIGNSRHKGSFFHSIARNDVDPREPFDLDGDEAFYMNAPRNSIIAAPVSGGDKFSKDLKLYFPFFSSHLSLPLKPGEHVWVFSDEDYGFWLSRITGIDIAEDANYTHLDREYELTLAMSLVKSGSVDAKGNTLMPKPVVLDPIPGFPNGEVVDAEHSTQKVFSTDQNKLTVPLLQGGYQNIFFNNSQVGSYIMESVPKLTKRCGDLVLQGSNNSAIILGTERGYTYAVNPSLTGSNAEASLLEQMGTIDLVVGRGRIYDIDAEKKNSIEDIKERFVRKALTIPRVVENVRGFRETLKNTAFFGHELIEGSYDKDYAQGDPDFVNDAARLHLSMDSKVDRNFSSESPFIPSLVNDSQLHDPVPQPGIPNSGVVAKADQVRIIARTTKLPQHIISELSDAPEMSGSIRIIKEGTIGAVNPDGTKRIPNASSIYMLPNGDVHISANKIFLGRSKVDGKKKSDYGGTPPGPGETQPFVRYEELRQLFDDLFTALDAYATAIENEKPPGNAGPLPLLGPAGGESKKFKDALTSIKTKTDNFFKLASERIFGE